MIKTPETFTMVNKDNLTGSGTGLACDIHGDNCVDINSNYYDHRQASDRRIAV